MKTKTRVLLPAIGLLALGACESAQSPATQPNPKSPTVAPKAAGPEVPAKPSEVLEKLIKQTPVEAKALMPFGPNDLQFYQLRGESARVQVEGFNLFEFNAKDQCELVTGLRLEKNGSGFFETHDVFRMKFHGIDTEIEMAFDDFDSMKGHGEIWDPASRSSRFRLQTGPLPFDQWAEQYPEHKDFPKSNCKIEYFYDAPEMHAKFICTDIYNRDPHVTSTIQAKGLFQCLVKDSRRKP